MVSYPISSATCSLSIIWLLIHKHLQKLKSFFLNVDEDGNNLSVQRHSQESLPSTSTSTAFLNFPKYSINPSELNLVSQISQILSIEQKSLELNDDADFNRSFDKRRGKKLIQKQLANLESLYPIDNDFYNCHQIKEASRWKSCPSSSRLTYLDGKKITLPKNTSSIKSCSSNLIRGLADLNYSYECIW